MNLSFLFRRSLRGLCAWGGIVVSVALVAPVRAAEVSTRLEEVVQRRAEAKQFAGAVLVTRRGTVLLDRGYGLANVEWDAPNTPETHFRIGSITKQFTAVSILLLEERGRLKLSDPVSVYLADAPAAWSGVTLRNLLTHTSGIPNVTGDPEFVLWRTQPTTPVQMVGRFRELPLDFPAGERFAYSNSNYLLLGLIVETLTGRRYGDFLREEVLNPLGLKETGLDSNLQILPRRANSYLVRGNRLINAPYIDITVPYAAGAMYSTTHDLWQWATAIYGDKLLSPASRAKLLTPEKNDYALGVEVRTVQGRKLIEHGGSISGFSSMLAHYPDEGVTVVVLSNLKTKSVSELARELETLALEEK